MNMNKPSLVVIAGPTASGKSALAMALAELVPSVIINADSMQVYRDLRIVTARPSDADEARHPHALFGHIDGAQACSAARWAGEASAVINDAHSKRLLPILVGGSGLYIRTLLDGIAPVPDIDAAIRSEVRALPVAEAHGALTREDADAALHLSPADTTRVARALEVVRSTGRTLGDWQAHRQGGIADAVRLVPLLLLPPREALAVRIEARFADIFEAGQTEVAVLVRRNLDPALPVMRAIGVREIAAFQAGELSRDAALEAGRLATRRYAKRQQTWFSNQCDSNWSRHREKLDNNNVHYLATKLRNMALTA